MTSHPTPFTLDRLTAGELSGETEKTVHDHLTVCGACRQYREQRLAEQDELLEHLSPAVFAARIADDVSREERGSSVSPRRRKMAWWFGVAVSSAAAAVFAVVIIGLLDTQPTPPDNTIRWMGSELVVRLHVLRDDSVLIGETPVVGDQVRYEVVLPPTAEGYAAVVGVEEGHVFVVLPEDGDPVPVTDTTFLRGSIDLQPGGGVVQLLLFVRPELFSSVALIDEVQRAVEAANDEWPEGLAHELSVDLGQP